MIKEETVKTTFVASLLLAAAPVVWAGSTGAQPEPTPTPTPADVATQDAAATDEA